MRRFAPFLLLLLAALPARPAAPPPPNYEPWTPDDVVNQEAASDLQFSPDGRFVVWVKSAPDKEKNVRVGQLFRTELATGKQVQLTRSQEACTSPRWSPDGAHLAFLSDRKAPKSSDEEKSRVSRRTRSKDEDETKTQIWLLDASGGEAWVLTEAPRNVSGFDWISNDALVFAAQEDAGRRETVLKDDKKDTSAVVEDDRHEPPVRLFEVEVKSKKVTRLTTNKDRIEQLSVAPNGKHAIALHGQSLRYQYDNKTKPQLFLHDLAVRTSRRVFADPKLNITALRWSPDSKAFYVTSDRSTRPEINMAGITDLHHFDMETGREGKVELNWPRGLAPQSLNSGDMGVVPVPGGFLALLADGVRNQLVRFALVNGHLTRVALEGEHAANVFGLAASRDGKRIAYAYSTAREIPQWYHARLDGGKLVEPKAIGALNEGLAKKRRARTEVVKWKGAYGDEVEGVLFYPHGHTPGKPAPLVVQIHGGPASADRDCWEDDWAYSANLLCQRGAFVLRPNYHGSTCYGLDWLESIAHGKYCEPEVEDIEKGVDALIARGLVDGKRLGLQGWSNGAILTNVLIAKTTRYKAAVAGAGTVEYVSDWASCEFGEAFDRFYLGKSPLEDLSLYLRKSPVHQYGKVETPVLIFFGTEDRVVHPQQGWMQYRTLQQLGKTVRFVQFPGEKHSLRKLSHQRRKLEEEMAWFDQHLFATVKVREDLIKDDSPLAWLLKKQAAKKNGSAYGELVKGVLTPETVRYHDIEVGRFEVTASQYAVFDRTYKVEPGKENFPAAGISFEKARDYCAWLSKQTGRRYRLPSETEAETLYEKGESGENTLDAWAGYTVNLDDATALRDKLKTLAAGSLLREVGAGRGGGKEVQAFDLGGNVAEWVQAKDGKGVLKGGSADMPTDTRTKGMEAATEYRGLRVVRE